MAKRVISINNHDQKYTVSEMRRRLAQVLSKLDGGQEVSFSFTATLENYRPAPTIHQIEAEENYRSVIDQSTDFATAMEKYNKLSPEQKHNSMHPVLGAPYGLSSSGLAGYARRMGADTTSGEEAPKDQYQIFAELHDITRDEAKARLLGHGYTFGGPAC